MFKSIRWKFIIIYFVLVFIAMIISGIFIIKYFEQSNIDVVSERLTNLSEILLPELEKHENLEDHIDEIDQMIKSHKSIGFSEEIFVISARNFNVLATSTENQEVDASSAIGEGYILLSSAMIGETTEVVVKKEYSSSKDAAFPIKNAADEVIGALYLRHNLKETSEALERIKGIIMQSTVLALFITIVLGYIIARSITVPINDVTEKAYKMAKGDFNQYVDVKSDDEIGKLAEMFNHLTRKLKLTLNEMSREKSKMEAIINYMADGLVAITDSGQILHANPKACDIFGYSKEKLLSFHYDDLIEKRDLHLTLKLILRNISAGEGSDKLTIGDAVYAINYAPFEGEDDKDKGVVLVFQDITEQQRLENMRREFVANVSHELKTPLTSIKSYTETLLDGLLDDKDMATQFLTVVDNEADRMARLVRDLLQLSNFDSKQVRFDMEYHSYNDLMKKALAKFDVTVRKKSQNLVYTNESESLIGYFDYDRIEQVVLNIVSNAIKYTPESGEIYVSLSKQEDSISLTVRDTGMGIPEEDLERIFERFYRVDKARSREMGGTGLGLAIAREIIVAHSGDINIRSVVDKGTEVCVVIPLEA